MVSRVQRVELLVPTVDKKSYNRIIGKTLEVTTNPALINTHRTEGKRVIFFNTSKELCEADHKAWLAERRSDGTRIVPCARDEDQRLRFAIQQVDEVRSGKMRARDWLWKFGNLSSDDAALDAEFRVVHDAIRGGQL